MRRIIETGLKKPRAPHAWAIASNGTLHSVHVPLRPDGSIEHGDATQQAEVTFADLQATLKVAGAGVEDVTLDNAVRTHLSLGKDAPTGRAIQRSGRIEVRPMLGGLHHRYVRI